jgi:hypothetical protein
MSHPLLPYLWPSGHPWPKQPTIFNATDLSTSSDDSNGPVLDPFLLILEEYFSGLHLPATQQHNEIPLPVAVNIECDRIASEMETVALSHHHTALTSLEPPYPGLGRMLCISHTWITSRHNSNILQSQ